MTAELATPESFGFPGESTTNDVQKYADQRVLPYVVGLLLLPWLLYIVNRSWTVLPPTGWIDPYFYVGYFFDLSGYMKEFGPSYYGSRLPWLLLGNGIHGLLPVEEANLLLRFLLFYTGTFSIFVAVNKLWRNATAAALAAVLMGFHPVFLGAIRWDYVDGPGLVMMAVALAAIAVARDTEGPKVALCVAGAALLIAMSNNLFQAVLLPAVLVWYIAVNSDQMRRLKDAPFILAGFVGAFAFFAVINYQVAGELNYLAPQIDARSIDQSSYRGQGYDWIHTASWLALHAAAVLAAVLVLARLTALEWRGLRPSSSEILLGATAVMFVLVASAFMFLQFADETKIPALEMPYYASFMVPFEFLLIGGTLSAATERFRILNWQRLATFCVVVVVSLLALAIRELRFSPNPEFLGPTGVLVVALALLLGLALLGHSRVAAAGVLGALCLLNAAMFNLGFVEKDAIERTENQALLILDARASLQERRPDHDVYFWYGSDETRSGVFVGIASTYLWYVRLVGTEFPDVPNERLFRSRIARNEFAVLTDVPNWEAKMTPSLESIGLRPVLQESWDLNRGRETLRMVLFTTEPNN